MNTHAPFREVPSLSRLLDVSLTVDVVEGPVTSIDNLEQLTVSIPTEEFKKMTGDELETLYLRPMVRSLAEKINSLGNVRTCALPMPKGKGMVAFSCTNGKIPVTLVLVRRSDPDRHQILISALVQPVDEFEDASTA